MEAMALLLRRKILELSIKNQFIIADSSFVGKRGRNFFF